MGKFLLRRKEVSRIVLQPTSPGNRAVFLVEAQDRREQQKVRHMFDTLAGLADVSQLADGPIMAYAVQLRGDVTLFGKIEEVLKEAFAFSVVDRTVSEVTFQLVESLCEDCDGRLIRQPRCGICDRVDPFPTRVKLQDAGGAEVLEAAYCARCAALQADPDRRKFLVDLLAADRRNFAGIRETRLVQAPPSAAADEHEPIATYAVA